MTKTCAMTGPNAANSNEEKNMPSQLGQRASSLSLQSHYSPATHIGRCLLGTSSAIATVKLFWTDPDSPPSTLPPMMVLTFWAVAPRTPHSIARILPPMKNHDGRRCLKGVQRSRNRRRAPGCMPELPRKLGHLVRLQLRVRDTAAARLTRTERLVD